MFLTVFFKLVIAHCLADYPLQGDFIGRFKNPNVPSPVPKTSIWWELLTAHAFIHAGAVWYITGVPLAGVCEFAAHWVIDILKCDDAFGYHIDQALHVLCKVLWVVIFVILKH